MVDLKETIARDLFNALQDWVDCHAHEDVRRLQIHHVVFNKFLLIDRKENVGYSVTVTKIIPIDGKLTY